VIDAVIFDLDGVLVDSEQLWSAVREQLVRDLGLAYPAEATRAMMGMSSLEWSRYMHDELHVDLEPEAISAAVVERLAARYREHLPLLPCAVETAAALGKRWPLGLASSSNREIIELVLELAGMAGLFEVTVSSEEVSRGKPAADVYLEASRRLDVPPARCAAIEDSTSGLRSAAAAGMKVVAVPNPHFPPEDDALRLAAVTVASLCDLGPELLADP
jgi:HAD superfamily hydrolase (TIGR01509 family)